MTGRTVRVATRSSPLARLQTGRVVARLEQLAGVGSVEVVAVETSGDLRTDVPISEIAGRGVFTTEVDAAVLGGRADLAVHSAKDLPSANLPAGLWFAAVAERGDPRDALVGNTLAGLAPGASIATGAPRRRVQLSAARGDLTFISLRGNIATRLAKVPTGGAVVVALVALERLELVGAVSEVLATSVVLPQVGQGAIALTCRDGDATALELAAAIDDAVAHRAVLAERAFLARLGGGCDAPVGAHATVAADGSLAIEAMIAGPDGRIYRRAATGADPTATGTALAEAMLQEDGAAAFVPPVG